MAPSSTGGTAAANRTKAPPDTAATGVDLLSALPDEILAKILFSIRTPDAVRTCVLSRRWRSVWKQLPDLHIPFLPQPAGMFRDALENYDQVPLRHLKVEGDGHGEGGLPRSLATWLPAAARRVSGSFTLLIDEESTRSEQDEDETDEQDEDEDEVAIELPCFKHATSISIDLRFRGRLTFPVRPLDDGVFSHLTDLWLECICFQDPSALGDAISSSWCPRLLTFHLGDSHGLEKLAVNSTSLLKVEIEDVGLRELSVEAPELTELHVVNCFCTTQTPVFSITAPRFVLLN